MSSSTPVKDAGGKATKKTTPTPSTRVTRGMAKKNLVKAEETTNNESNATPSDRLTRGLVLFGSAQLLRDIVVEFHRIKGEWKELYLTGLALVPELEATRGDVQARGELCDKMGDIVVGMMQLHTEMSSLRDRVVSLAKYNAHSPPPFNTWKYVQFVEVFTKMVDIFHHEIFIRHIFLQDCTRISTTGEELNSLKIGWVQLIYANDSCDLEFEAMLNEIELSTS